MSHYAVAVIHKPEQSVEELLAPYNENLEVEKYLYKTREQVVESAKKTFKSDYSSDDEWFDAYVRGWNILDENIDKDRNIYSTYNPESRWDWWVYGGRFAYMLKSKIDNQYYDSLPIKDIDFSPNEEEYNQAICFWEGLFENNLSEEEKPFTLYKDEYYLNRYKNKETYAKYESSLSTYAVVTPDGKWNAPGEVGWFGASTESDEEYVDWKDHWHERFVEPYEDYIMTIVDCHI